MAKLRNADAAKCDLLAVLAATGYLLSVNHSRHCADDADVIVIDGCFLLKDNDAVFRYEARREGGLSPKEAQYWAKPLALTVSYV